MYHAKYCHSLSKMCFDFENDFAEEEEDFDVDENFVAAGFAVEHSVVEEDFAVVLIVSFCFSYSFDSLICEQVQNLLICSDLIGREQQIQTLLHVSQRLR